MATTKKEMLDVFNGQASAASGAVGEKVAAFLAGRADGRARRLREAEDHRAAEQAPREKSIRPTPKRKPAPPPPVKEEEEDEPVGDL